MLYEVITNITLLHFTARNGFLDGNLDDVADTGITAVRTTQNLNTHYAACVV